MNVLVDATGVVNKMTGIGRYSGQLLASIADIDQYNMYTVLLQQGLRNDHPVWNLTARNNFALKRVAIPAVGPRRQMGFPRVIRAMRGQIDLMHSFNSELPVLHNLRSVVTIHDLKYLKFSGFLRRLAWAKKSYMKHSLRASCTKARRIIAVSESTKRDITSLFGTDPEKISVIHEAFSPESFSSLDPNAESAILNQYSISKPYFLYVGEIRPHKNLEGMIQAFGIFKQKHDKQETQLVIVGKEYSDYDAILNRSDQLTTKKSVVFVGAVPDSHLQTFYKQAELFLLVSFYEGFGLPILEAMGCQIPVITSNVSAMPEVAGDAALLINPSNLQEIAEAMHRITSSEVLKRKLVEKGIAQVKKFTWERAARETLQVYRQTLNN